VVFLPNIDHLSQPSQRFSKDSLDKFLRNRLFTLLNLDKIHTQGMTILYKKIFFVHKATKRIQEKCKLNRIHKILLTTFLIFVPEIFAEADLAKRTHYWLLLCIYTRGKELK
jgi:hypothetical protein